MPEQANRSAFDKCNSCATSDGPGLGPLPTVSHTQVCCLFKVARPGQYAPFPNEGSHKRYDYDGLCEGCPSRLKFQEELQVGPVDRPPQRSSNVPQEDIVALATRCETAPEVAGSPSKKRKKIEPRLRVGFTKLTLEIRPPKFKKKLWFGTYTEAEVDRARDAVNYYTGSNEQYSRPDSPLIFAEKPLKGLKFEELLPSCDQVIQVGDKEEFAYKYFARQVKEVIHAVTGKQKKFTQKKIKCKVSKKLQFLLKEAPQRLDIYDPIVLSAPGSTSSSDTQYVACPSSEASSQLETTHPMCLPPARMFPHDEEITELFRSSNQWSELGVLTLEEMFNFPSVIPTSGYGESSTMEESGYLANLWDFPNEDPSLPSE